MIPQVSHTFLAWQLAEHWGNRGFVRPSPRAEVLAAVLLHDGGWYELDANPGLDQNARVRTYTSLSVNDTIGVWRMNVLRASMTSRYVGLLVAAHFAQLAERKAAALLASGDTTGSRRILSLQAELERQQDGWREVLEDDARYETSLRGPGWETNLRMLVACDKVSIFLCGSHPSGFSIEVVNRSGVVVSPTFSQIEERSWKVQPWPFRGSAVRLRCEGRRVGSVRFASVADLQEALQNAPVERLTFTLLRPSAKE